MTTHFNADDGSVPAFGLTPASSSERGSPSDSPKPRSSVPSDSLTARIRFLASGMIVVFLVSWLSWFAPFDDWLDRSGTPWGADFAMFYVAGRMVADGQIDQLYDLAAQQAKLQQIFPTIASDFALPYRYPPWVAWLMSPLARLPYPAAFGLFAGLSLLAWLGGCQRLLRNWRGAGGVTAGVVLLALAGWPVALETWIGGQASLLACCLLVCVLELLRANRPVWAGAVLATLTYKPNLLCLVMLGLLILRPRMLMGWLPTVLAGWVGTVWYWGPQPLYEYWQLSQALALQPWNIDTPAAKVHGWAVALLPLCGARARTGVLGFGVLLTGLVILRQRHDERRGEDRWNETVALLLAINAGWNLYTPIYDLALLAISVILALQSPLGISTIRPAPPPWFVSLTLAAGYFGPHLSQTVLSWVGWQLSLLGLTAWTAWLFHRRFMVAPPSQPIAS